ncbi:dTDP-4-dehydrorhamnose 3,5-epimerase family protein [Dankookia sp. P2]|uniref:dTDP-4-dehydrorhamnose 3,5-epimerase family protein n=1 Tax=Dankookia sp. P2 TaxID=3423955 RepID=UPI003D67C00E
MHWQASPAEEGKLVRCLRGADLRRCGRPAAGLARLPALGGRGSCGRRRTNALLIPPGCAHGFLTLTDDAWLEYMIDAPYAPGAGRGARWDDPAFGIVWPAAPAVISERDAQWPDHG